MDGFLADLMDAEPSLPPRTLERLEWAWSQGASIPELARQFELSQEQIASLALKRRWPTPSISSLAVAHRGLPRHVQATHQRLARYYDTTINLTLAKLDDPSLDIDDRFALEDALQTQVDQFRMLNGVDMAERTQEHLAKQMAKIQAIQAVKGLMSDEERAGNPGLPGPSDDDSRDSEIRECYVEALSDDDRDPLA